MQPLPHGLPFTHLLGFPVVALAGVAAGAACVTGVLVTGVAGVGVTGSAAKALAVRREMAAKAA